MKRLALIFPALLLCTVCVFAAPSPQGDTTALMRKLDEYLLALDGAGWSKACGETDFIVSSVQDSVLRNAVAVKIYRHFRHSNVMGSENVAVYVFDRWFSSWQALFPSLEEYEDAEFYAFVNRQSLLGCEAPEGKFVDERGDSLSVHGKRRVSIVYFYSTSCPKCLYTSLKIKELLNNGKFRADFCAIYTGDDDMEWKKYVASSLDVRGTCRLRVHHLRCPQESDFVTAWGVVQTPRLFLLDKNGRIVGRNLDAQALEKLLKLYC